MTRNRVKWTPRARMLFTIIMTVIVFAVFIFGMRELSGQTTLFI